MSVQEINIIIVVFLSYLAILPIVQMNKKLIWSGLLGTFWVPRDLFILAALMYVASYQEIPMGFGPSYTYFLYRKCGMGGGGGTDNL